MSTPCGCFSFVSMTLCDTDSLALVKSIVVCYYLKLASSSMTCITDSLPELSSSVVIAVHVTWLCPYKGIVILSSVLEFLVTKSLSCHLRSTHRNIQWMSCVKKMHKYVVLYTEAMFNELPKYYTQNGLSFMKSKMFLHVQFLRRVHSFVRLCVKYNAFILKKWP